MAKQAVTIYVEASNVLEAEPIRQGIQSVVDELGDNQGFLIELGKPGVARQYRQRLDSVMKNPLFKTLASKF